MRTALFTSRVRKAVRNSAPLITGLTLIYSAIVVDYAIQMKNFLLGCTSVLLGVAGVIWGVCMWQQEEE